MRFAPIALLMIALVACVAASGTRYHTGIGATTHVDGPGDDFDRFPSPIWLPTTKGSESGR